MKELDSLDKAALQALHQAPGSLKAILDVILLADCFGASKFLVFRILENSMQEYRAITGTPKQTPWQKGPSFL